MPSTADQIKKTIEAFWTSTPRVEPRDHLWLDTRDQIKLAGSYSWTPRSVDPTDEERYGFAVGTVKQVSPSNHWMIPLFFGLRDSGNTLSPFLSMPLFVDGQGNIAHGTSSTLVQSEKDGTSVEVPEELFFAPEEINAALLVFFFAGQLAELIARLGYDNDAAQLALAPLSGLIMNQAISAARKAVRLGDDPAGLARVIADLDSAAPRYDARIKSWPLGGGWPDKEGNAKSFGDDGLRIWRPSVVVDQNIWALQTKVDLVYPVAVDDHLIITAAGQRQADGTLKLVSMSTSARFTDLPEKHFTIKPGKNLDRGDVFAVWADTLRGNVISLSAEEQKRVERVIRRVGNKRGEHTGQDLLAWIAGAESAG